MAATSPKDFIGLDEQFHRTLADGAGKRGAWRLIEGLKSQMDRVRFLSLGHFPVAKLVSQHRAVVDAIARGDLAAADTAIRTHLREVLIDLPQIHAANPEFFKQMQVIETRRTNKYRRITANQALTTVTTALQGLPRHLQQQALLRVHGNGFSGRNIKKLTVKTVDLVHQTGGQVAG